MIKRFLSRKGQEGYDEAGNEEDEYVELDTAEEQTGSQRVVVRPMVLDDFSKVKEILDVLREGETICIVNIKPLREKDIVELKRAINKLKKTCEAVSGDIAGFGEDYIIAAPSYAEIYRTSSTTDNLEE